MKFHEITLRRQTCFWGYATKLSIMSRDGLINGLESAEVIILKVISLASLMS